MISCPLCNEPARSRDVTVRSGKKMVLWHCEACDYDFFIHDPTESLAANKLDDSRLKSSGLNIPSRETDFVNGLNQSRPYINEYLTPNDRDKNILEIGCSWGYFLKLVEEAGSIPYGVEVNLIRAQYVREDLKISCFPDLESCETSGIHFHKIFLFYVLEYIPQPVVYLKRLNDLLEPNGSIIIITPNLNDAIKDFYRNEGFIHFFYDEHAINYFSCRSIRQIAKAIDKPDAAIETRQGYSFINHINWFLTGSPRTTQVVGGDNFVKNFTTPLRETESGNFPGVKPENKIIAGELADLIEEFDQNYRRVLETYGYGNQIRIIIDK